MPSGIAVTTLFQPHKNKNFKDLKHDVYKKAKKSPTKPWRHHFRAILSHSNHPQICCLIRFSHDYHIEVETDSTVVYKCRHFLVTTFHVSSRLEVAHKWKPKGECLVNDVMKGDIVVIHGTSHRRETLQMCKSVFNLTNHMSAHKEKQINSVMFLFKM